MQGLIADSRQYGQYVASPTLMNVPAPSAYQIAEHQRTGKPVPSYRPHDPSAHQRLAQAIVAGGTNPLAGAAGAMSHALGGNSDQINTAMIRTDALTGPILNMAPSGGGANRTAGTRVRQARPPNNPVPNSSGLETARLKDLAIAPDAHAYTKHGGWVTDDLLRERAWTGIAPGSTAPSFRYPSSSSAFHSDELLAFADSSIRSSGVLEARLAANPNLRNISINPSMVGDLGVDLGRGYIPVRPFEQVGAVNYQGPLMRVDNMNSAGGFYRFNPATQQFDMITLYPAVKK